ncbi:hypothetical protein [Pseudophaeobacter sp.]|uniref:hypothetical protein n=1 Tax=Pseudophaeobacter sp. TaxID=1971739 RepID=UPI0032984402
MTSSILPLLKFLALALLGGSATITAASLVLGLGPAAVSAQGHIPTGAISVRPPEVTKTI